MTPFHSGSVEFRAALVRPGWSRRRDLVTGLSAKKSRELELSVKWTMELRVLDLSDFFLLVQVVDRGGFLGPCHSLASSDQPNSKGRRPEEIPRRHAGPKEHHPGIGRAGRRARPILNRRRVGKHRFVDRGPLAVGRYNALQLVLLGKSPSDVSWQAQSIAPSQSRSLTSPEQPPLSVQACP
jgi:hypothetical protein